MNFKNEAVFSSSQKILDNELNNVNSIELPPQTDPSLLSMVSMHDLLHNHSIMLTALLEMIPEEAVARVYNDSGTDLTPALAIQNLKDQQNRVNMLFRNVEHNKLTQLLKSANMATNISLIHELPT